MGILEHRPQGAAQVVLSDGLDVDAVIGDQPALYLIKAVDEVGDGGLSRPGGAHKGDLLPRIGIDGYILQDAFPWHIGEVHMVEAHCAPQLREVIFLPGHIAHRAPDEMERGRAHVVRILPGPAVTGQGGQILHLGQRAVRGHLDPDALVGIGPRREQLQPAPLPDGLAQLGKVLPLGQNRDQGHTAGPGCFPGPGVGVPCAGEWGQRAIGILLRLHQGDLPLVHLGLSVHDLKNALGSSQGGEQGSRLLRDLVQGLSHLLGVVQIDHQTAQVKALEHRQQPTKGCGKGIADVH